MSFKRDLTLAEKHLQILEICWQITKDSPLNYFTFDIHFLLYKAVYQTFLLQKL